MLHTSATKSSGEQALFSPQRKNKSSNRFSLLPSFLVIVTLYHNCDFISCKLQLQISKLQLLYKFTFDNWDFISFNCNFIPYNLNCICFLYLLESHRNFNFIFHRFKTHVMIATSFPFISDAKRQKVTFQNLHPLCSAWIAETTNFSSPHSSVIACFLITHTRLFRWIVGTFHRLLLLYLLYYLYLYWPNCIFQPLTQYILTKNV